MSAIEVGDESLGQCEAHHPLFGRCHYVPHGPEVNHWIEYPKNSGRGITFVAEAVLDRG